MGNLFSFELPTKIPQTVVDIFVIYLLCLSFPHFIPAKIIHMESGQGHSKRVDRVDNIQGPEGQGDPNQNKPIGFGAHHCSLSMGPQVVYRKCLSYLGSNIVFCF